MRSLGRLASTDLGFDTRGLLWLALVAFVASVWPAMRAARVNPVQALRGG